MREDGSRHAVEQRVEKTFGDCPTYRHPVDEVPTSLCNEHLYTSGFPMRRRERIDPGATTRPGGQTSGGQRSNALQAAVNARGGSALLETAFL
jgi:hypothetical protein